MSPTLITPAYRRARALAVAAELGPCSCGEPIWIKHSRQCKNCYQRAYRARAEQARLAARQAGVEPVAGSWTPPPSTPEEKRARARERWHERMSDPNVRARRREVEAERRRRPEVRERLREYRAARAADPEIAERDRAVKRLTARQRYVPRPKPTAAEREAQRQQRRVEYERRLIDDPDFRREALASERERMNEKTREKNARRAKRRRVEPEYRARLRAKERERHERRFATDPEYAARYRAQRAQQERERRARRRAERQEAHHHG